MRTGAGIFPGRVRPLERADNWPNGEITRGFPPFKLFADGRRPLGGISSLIIHD
ncbi:MAG: hypothetical protein R2861_04075 [Desulfobacterales bacterium]